MLEEIRQAAARQRKSRVLRAMTLASRLLLSQQGEMNGMAVARRIVDHLDGLEGSDLGPYFDFLARELDPDPRRVLQLAQAYATRPSAAALIELVQAVEPPRQELLRRLNRTPGGTAAILRLRRALLRVLPGRPDLLALEADLLHLLTSWFNPGFLQMRRVDWHAPAELLEKLMLHEAVHAIDGWDDLRRRLQPDRRCFAFFHPQLPEEPLIFVEVALLPEMPGAIAPLIDKASTPLPPDRFRVAAFYSISNCEPGLRGVSLGNFLIKSVAAHLQLELPRVKTFCTLSPLPGFAAWLLSDPDLAALPRLRRTAAPVLQAARQRLLQTTGGDLRSLQRAAWVDKAGHEDQEALARLAAAYLVSQTPEAGGDPVGRFHLDNGARLERLNPLGDRSAKGLRQSFGVMVNYLYDLHKIEASHTKFRAGEVVRSRAVGSLL